MRGRLIIGVQLCFRIASKQTIAFGGVTVDGQRNPPKNSIKADPTAVLIWPFSPKATHASRA
jgi:hypothetical protein